MLNDIEISKSARMKPIDNVAGRIGIRSNEIELFGKYKAKVSLSIFERLQRQKQGKYILVSAITPTPLGEGKTVTTIGLSMALNRLRKRSACCIREASLGPVFGIKGGAAGGGFAQAVPMEDFNLHFTGDTYAIEAANNLCAAFLDNALCRENKLNIDISKIWWRRCMDVNDRSLRNITVGMDDNICKQRKTGFDITAASEVMSIVSLAKDFSDLKERISRIVVALNNQGKPVTAKDIRCSGAMMALLKNAIRPNLMQTLENTPCFVHTGPFANFSHGNSSIIADLIALKTNDYVVTESGFGADIGAEKFMDIKCRYSNLRPDCAVLVCSLRALKMHSGKFEVKVSQFSTDCLIKEDVEAVKSGSSNLLKQIENIKKFSVPLVVAINRFPQDSEKEIQAVIDICKDAGVDGVAVSKVWQEGAKGGEDLAKQVIEACEKENNFKFLYELNAPIKDKIKVIATQMYGAKDVKYSELAEEKIKQLGELGFADLPICMVKTRLSLSHDAKLKGRPEGFILPVEDIRAFIGAGFLSPLCGNIHTMPGLSVSPGGERISVENNGNVKGLS